MLYAATVGQRLATGCLGARFACSVRSARCHHFCLNMPAAATAAHLPLLHLFMPVSLFAASCAADARSAGACFIQW
jgi:hypothetical protein